MSDERRKLVEEARAAISPEQRFYRSEVERTELIRRLADALEESERERASQPTLRKNPKRVDIDI